MEEKESTVSGSLGNSDTDSPPAPLSSMAMPRVMNINMNMSMERAIDGAGAFAGVAGTPGSGVGTFGSGGTGGEGGVDSSGKKKRGRPRKYDADGNLRLPYQIMTPLPGFTLSPSPPEHSKRGRGRPSGSLNRHLIGSLGELFANTAGGNFTPLVVTVNTGEDVARKILSLSQKGPRGICVLSANGAVSNVTIRQPGSSGGILTYEGRFEILSLTGSFTVSETGGGKSRTGDLSVSLAGPDGRVIGGGLAGILVAASPIQIVVGSFMPNGYKVHKRKHYREPTKNSTVLAAPETVTAAQPISQVKPDSKSAYIAPTSSQLGQSHGEPDFNTITNDQQLPNPMSSHSAVWNGLEPTLIQRPSPDINMSVPSE
ncbi:hypothetical protein SLEP1_g11322 [Rubroshorea leprosula]|uniref:AT-hook motif nuclear-localized protein n=1 Tax=Rubroshorea leprosula TaxID=152421 RepID=A0AAV5IAZ2_9ROSI|nr:hypothetical protein SLEP1_g11322 [Rubroshorea leprosula]